MSVDKFGRYSEGIGGCKETAGVKGSPGIGFILTQNGDYDIQNKRLCNVSEAVDDGDAITLQTFKRKFSKCLKSDKDGYYAEGKRLRGTADPIDLKDAINLDTLIKQITKCLQLQKSTDDNNTAYLAGGKRIKGVADPIGMTDAVNYQTITEETSSLWKQLSLCLQYNEKGYDLAGKRLSGLPNPAREDDAINYKFFLNNINTVNNNIKSIQDKLLTSFQVNGGAYDARGKRIINLAEPTEEGDAVSMHYLYNVIYNMVDIIYNIIKVVKEKPHDTDGIIDVVVIDKAISIGEGVVDIKTSTSARYKEILLKGILNARLRPKDE